LSAHQERARVRLRALRQGSALAVALTALLLMVAGVVDDSAGQAVQPVPEVPVDARESIDQAAGTVRELLQASYALLPKLALALLLIGGAILAARIATAILRRTLGRWEKAEAVSALVRIALYLIAIAVSLSVLAGDASALLGSLGLVGLALSWALQTPIESFTGWLLNSFRSYYRVGDRIEVGDVFGDVYKIDVLTTTVWEAGGPGKAVAGAQPTGAMVTFPNWEVLRSNIINYSREFPFVWDEVTVSVGNESDLPYTAATLEAVARDTIGPGMRQAAAQYEQLLSRARIAFDVDEQPRVFFSAADAWTNCTVRYLVDARKRRRTASDLAMALSTAMADPVHQGRIVGAYPRSEVRLRRSWRRGDPARAEP
jgi:small-conductance mechanosensitive channel